MPGSFVALAWTEATVEKTVGNRLARSSRSVSSSAPLNSDLSQANHFSLLTIDAANVSNGALSGSRQCLSWFLSPYTWKIDHRVQNLSTTSTYSNPFLRSYVTYMQDWLGRWATTGNNPFIHPHLYTACFPDSVQIAFTTLTSYIHRTDENADFILRIVEEQASKLLSDNGVVLDNTIADSKSTLDDNSLSLLDQVARTHALVVYQTISLFDGDIRSRHLAEKRLHLLGRWATQLMESARQKFSPQSAVLDATLSHRYDAVRSCDDPWYLWILTECIRRVWLIATGLETIYFMLQRGWHPCPGGIMYTTRSGVWDAQTAADWEDVCSEADVGFLQRFDTEKLFHEARPADVDEFSQTMMEITFGYDRIEKWRQQKRN